MNSRLIYNFVERLSELLKVDSRQAGLEHGLQPVQLEALHYLHNCNRYSDTPMAVTEYLGQTKGTVSQTLKVLEKKGFIAKKADKEDKRITHLKITAKGKRVIEKTIPTEMFNKACEALNEEQQVEIVGSLRQLLISLLQENDMKSFGICNSCRFHIKTDDENDYCDLLQESLTAQDGKKICREHTPITFQ